MWRHSLLTCTTLLTLAPLAPAQTGLREGTPPSNAGPTPPAVTAPVTSPTYLYNPCECLPEKQGPWYQVWGSFGYARWQIKDAPIAYTLATTGSGDNPGALGDPATTILFSNNALDYGNFNGLRFDAGVWLNEKHTLGIGAGFTSFANRSTSTFFDSETGPDPLYRPIFDAQTFQSVGLLVADLQQGVTGSLLIENRAKFYGFDLHAVANVANNETFTVDGIFGYRYFSLRESLTITQNSQVVPGGVSPFVISQTPEMPEFQSVNSLLIQDSFATRNTIHGVQLGARTEGRYGLFFASLAGKVTFGVNQQRVDINGFTQGTTANEAVLTSTGGVLAVGGAPVSPVDPSSVTGGNLGQHRYNHFIVMPELGFQVGMQVSTHVRLYAGYEWLYISDVVRPGTQIDPVINQRYVPSSPAFGFPTGPDAPNLPRARSDFMAHGLSIGLEVQY